MASEAVESVTDEGDRGGGSSSGSLVRFEFLVFAECFPGIRLVGVPEHGVGVFSHCAVVSEGNNHILVLVRCTVMGIYWVLEVFAGLRD